MWPLFFPSSLLLPELSSPFPGLSPGQDWSYEAVLYVTPCAERVSFSSARVLEFLIRKHTQQSVREKLRLLDPSPPRYLLCGKNMLNMFSLRSREWCFARDCLPRHFVVRPKSKWFHPCVQATNRARRPQVPLPQRSALFLAFWLCALLGYGYGFVHLCPTIRCQTAPSSRTTGSPGRSTPCLSLRGG